MSGFFARERKSNAALAGQTRGLDRNPAMRPEAAAGCAKLKHRGTADFAARSRFAEPAPAREDQTVMPSICGSDRSVGTKEASHLD
jgi:hypothetical protein